MVTYSPITFPDGTTVTPKSVAEAVAAKRMLAKIKRQQEGRVSIAEKRKEAKKQGLSRTGGVYKKSRGQQLAEDAGQITAFADRPEQFSGYRTDLGEYKPPRPDPKQLPGYRTDLGEYKPPRPDPNMTPTQQQLTKALYDLNYTKQALGVSQKETESIRTGVAAEQERSGVEREKEKTKGEGLSFEDLQKNVEQITNPEYAKLTENEKVLNRIRKEEGKSFIPEKISAKSGRAPIKDTLSRKEKLSAQQLSQAVDQLGQDALRVMAANLDLMSPSQKAAAQDYLRTQAASRAESLVQEISENVKEEIDTKQKLIRAKLNLRPNEQLTFTEDGQPLINGMTESERAIERARKEVQKEKDEYLEDKKEAHKNELARIRSAHTVNGNLTNKGRQELAEVEREYQKETKETLEKIDENLQEYENKQKERQAEVELQIAQSHSIEAKLNRDLAQEKASGAYNIQTEYEKLGKSIGFLAAIDEYERRQGFPEDLTQAEKAEVLDSQIFQEGFDTKTALETATEVFDNDLGKAERYLKSRGFLKRQIQDQKERYQMEVLGYTPEQIEDQKQNLSVKEILDKSVAGEELTFNELEKLEEFEAGSPHKAARWRMKLENPWMTEAEIYLAVKEEFSGKKSTSRDEDGEKEVSIKSEDDATDQARKAITGGYVEAGDLAAWLEDNFEISNAAIERIRKRFTDYDPSTRQHVIDQDALDPPEELSTPAEAQKGGVKTLGDMTPFERERFLEGVDVEALQEGFSQMREPGEVKKKKEEEEPETIDEELQFLESL